MDSDIQIAEQFGTSLAKEDFAAAYGLLTGSRTQRRLVFLDAKLELSTS